MLGNGANVEQPSPTPVAGGRNFYVVAPGVTQTCALAEDGSAWCWGKSPGNGQTTSVNQPAQVSGGHKFVALSTGTDYACGLDTSGDLWCWGEHNDGCGLACFKRQRCLQPDQAHQCETILAD